MIKPEKKPVETDKTNLYGEELGSGSGGFTAHWGLSAVFVISMLGKASGLNGSAQLGMQR